MFLHDAKDMGALALIMEHLGFEYGTVGSQYLNNRKELKKQLIQIKLLI